MLMGIIVIVLNFFVSHQKVNKLNFYIIDMVEKKDSSEKIGFHKGSLATLTKEREELMRILQIVEQLMQMHIQELKTLGVDLVAEAKKVAAQKNPTKKLKGKKAIEDVL
jgi:hypothetical protein